MRARPSGRARGLIPASRAGTAARLTTLNLKVTAVWAQTAASQSLENLAWEQLNPVLRNVYGPILQCGSIGADIIFTDPKGYDGLCAGVANGMPGYRAVMQTPRSLGPLGRGDSSLAWADPCFPIRRYFPMPFAGLVRGPEGGIRWESVAH